MGGWAVDPRNCPQAARNIPPLTAGTSAHGVSDQPSGIRTGWQRRCCDEWYARCAAFDSMGWHMSVVLEHLAARITDMVGIIEGEFHEMPGMRLTRPQVRRLWNLSEEECEQILGCMCRAGVLIQDETGRYFRPSGN